MPESIPILKPPPATTANQTKHDMTTRLSTVEANELASPAFSRAADQVEIRFYVDPTDLQVLDGHCQATGASRVSVLKALLEKWSADKAHEATVICRTAGINPHAPESGRRAA